MAVTSLIYKTGSHEQQLTLTILQQDARNKRHTNITTNASLLGLYNSAPLPMTYMYYYSKSLLYKSMYL